VIDWFKISYRKDVNQGPCPEGKECHPGLGCWALVAHEQPLLYRIIEQHQPASPRNNDSLVHVLPGNEVADTLAQLDLKVDKSATFWGTLSVFGIWETEEVSHCWKDQTNLAPDLELWQSQGLIFGHLTQASRKGGTEAVLFHNTGPRCAGSDQGTIVTERDSIEILALGYHSSEEKGIYLMLEPYDITHWTLKSGGDIGAGSWMQFYLPSMYATHTATGGFSAMFVSDSRIKQGTAIYFRGHVSGTGGNTSGEVALLFHPYSGKNDRMSGVTNDIIRKVDQDIHSGTLTPK